MELELECSAASALVGSLIHELCSNAVRCSLSPAPDAYRLSSHFRLLACASTRAVHSARFLRELSLSCLLCSRSQSIIIGRLEMA